MSYACSALTNPALSQAVKLIFRNIRIVFASDFVFNAIRLQLTSVSSTDMSSHAGHELGDNAWQNLEVFVVHQTARALRHFNQSQPAASYKVIKEDCTSAQCQSSNLNNVGRRTNLPRVHMYCINQQRFPPDGLLDRFATVLLYWLCYNTA
jgi:hypothetical protein